MKHVVMPALGMAMTECLLLQWLKEPGERVAAGEVVAEVETDKATTELESPTDGVMGRHLFEAGSTVAIGTAIAWILEGGEAEPDTLGPSGAVHPPIGAPDAHPDKALTLELPVPAEGATTRDEGGMDEGSSDGGEPPRRSARAKREARQASRAAAATASVAGSSPVALAGGDGAAPPVSSAGIRLAARQPDALDAPSITAPIDVSGISTDTLLGWLRTMMLIRTFERELVRLSIEGLIPAGIHSSEGQEAVAVGALSALGPDDAVAGTHRSHHHALARGLKPRALMAELFGKADGCSGGRGGSMHLVDPALHFLGSNGIVGAGIGLATGAGLAFHLRGTRAIGLGFVGDGGANTGRVWESVNLAALWKLPVIFVCENNLYAVETRITDSFAGSSIADRASGFGLPAVIVDGQDVVAVHHVVAEARARALASGGPTFIEARTYRYEGHNVGEVQDYRTEAEVAEWRARMDPIERLRSALFNLGALDDPTLDGLAADTRGIVADAIEFAAQAAWPVPQRNAVPS